MMEYLVRMVTGRWTKIETEFLNNRYPKKGASWVAEHLGRNVFSVKNRVQYLGLKIEQGRPEEMVLRFNKAG